jgi:lysophospholipase L1-like esterase
MANKPGEANFFPDVPEFPSMGVFQPIYGKFDLTTYIQGASDYEIMAFLVGKYNACLEAYGTVTKLSTNTITACKQLQDWINNWFTNLDVQEEINKKLDSMVADGSFGTLLHQTFDTQINQQTTNAVTAWLIANVTPTGGAVTLDKSLTIEGSAADSKATGLVAYNSLNFNLYSGSLTIDTTNIPRSNAIQIPQFIGKYDEHNYPNTIATDIRMSTYAFSVTEACTIIANTGYEFELNKVENAKLIAYTGWEHNRTIEPNTQVVILIRKSDNSTCAITDIYKAIKILPPYIYNGWKVCTGNYTYTDFNKPINPNFSELPTTIRHHMLYVKPPFQITALSDTPISVFSLMKGNYFNSTNTLTTNSQTAKIYSDCLIELDSNNTNFNEIVKIEPLDALTFTAGGTSRDSENKLIYNDSNTALPIRLRTDIIKLDRAIHITTDTTHSFSVEYVDSNDVIIEQHFWVKDYIVKPGRVCITLRKDNNGTVLLANINSFTKMQFLKTYNTGASVLFIGDSITENNYTATCNWTRNIEAIFDVSDYENVAMSGTGIIAGGSNGWLNRLASFPDKQFDCILIMGNMNDYSNNIFNANNLGQFGDSGTETEYGAVDTFIKQLCNKYPNSKIGWIVSTPRQYYASDDDNPNPITTDGYLYGLNSPFYKAGKAIEDICANYSIPVLNLFENSNFKCWLKATKDQYFYNDGNMVHPNNDGNRLMTKQIIPFVKKLMVL